MDKAAVFASTLARFPIQEDPNEHLSHMTISQLCERRREVAKHMKELDSEKKDIDQILFDTCSDNELKQGIRLRSGDILRMKTRTSYDYPDTVVDAVASIRREARDTQSATPYTTQYITIAST